MDKFHDNIKKKLENYGLKNKRIHLKCQKWELMISISAANIQVLYIRIIHWYFIFFWFTDWVCICFDGIWLPSFYSITLTHTLPSALLSFLRPPPPHPLPCTMSLLAGSQMCQSVLKKKNDKSGKEIIIMTIMKWSRRIFLLFPKLHVRRMKWWNILEFFFLSHAKADKNTSYKYMKLFQNIWHLFCIFQTCLE